MFHLLNIFQCFYLGLYFWHIATNKFDIDKPIKFDFNGLFYAQKWYLFLSKIIEMLRVIIQNLLVLINIPVVWRGNHNRLKFHLLLNNFLHPFSMVIV